MEYIFITVLKFDSVTHTNVRPIYYSEKESQAQNLI